MISIALGLVRYNGVQSLHKFHGAGNINLDFNHFFRLLRRCKFDELHGATQPVAPFCYSVSHGYSFCRGIFLTNMGWSHRQLHSLLLEGHTWRSLLADYFHYSHFTVMAFCHLLNEFDVYSQRYYSVSVRPILKIKF